MGKEEERILFQHEGVENEQAANATTMFTRRAVFGSGCLCCKDVNFGGCLDSNFCSTAY